jgi:trk system potassium uptake protein TrkA
MRILICGAGRVGHGIARRLAREKHDITLIDGNPALIDQVTNELDVRGVVGHAAHPEVLKAAGVADCEMIIAVTHLDEINMVICQIARTLFQVPYKIARVRDQSYLDPAWKTLFSRDGLDIDMVISPELEVGEAILQRLRTPGAILTASFARGKLKVLGIELDAESPLNEVRVADFRGLFPDLAARVVGIGREDRVFAPERDDTLQTSDRVYVAVADHHAGRLGAIFQRDPVQTEQIIIAGGGNVGLYVARALEKETNKRVRVIESGAERAGLIAGLLRRSVVMHGDALSPEIQTEAGVAKADYIIAATNDDKTNLLICSLAKRAGCKRAMALVNSPLLAGLSREMRVDVVLDPRALTISQVLMRMRRGRILGLHSIEDGRAEIAEGVVLESSPLLGASLDYGDQGEGIAVAGVLHKEKLMLAGADVKAVAGDHVIVLYEEGHVKQAEKFFRISPEFF